jgi:hypothetical protein
VTTCIAKQREVLRSHVGGAHTKSTRRTNVTGSLRDRIKNEAASGGGFRPHPPGTYPGTIVDITQREYQGQQLFEFKVKTDAGTAKTTIWKTTLDDIETLYGGRAKSRAEAEERYVKTMGRLCRMYRDLGLDEPDAQTTEEIEGQAWERLGEMLDRDCTIVVKANPAKPENPTVFINAPRGGARVTTSGPAASAFDEAPPISDSEIPF